MTIDNPPPSPPPAPPTGPKPPKPSDMRLFVVEVKNAEGAIAGYAIAQRVEWIPIDVEPSLYPTAQLVAGLLNTLMERAGAEGLTARALPLPATDDQGGGGSLMFMASQFMASEELQAFLGRRPSEPDDGED